MRSSARLLTGAFSVAALTIAGISGTAVGAAAPSASRAGGESSAGHRLAAADVVNTFKNRATGACLDDSNAGLRAFPCNGGNYQKWNVHVFNDGTRELRNQATGACLDDSTAGLRAFPCNKSKFQSWWVKSWGDGSIELKNQATSACLDDSNAGLRAFSCNGLNYQRWA